ncbi:MAG: ArnT family glycosyltransferase [Candidatus Methylomirabilaceae bacterium]
MARWRTLETGSPFRQLAVTLVLAILLRVIGNQHDAPYWSHPDEHHYVGNAVQMFWAGTLNPAYFVNPPLYTYVILLGLYGVFGIQLLIGGAETRAGFLATLSPAVPFVIGRGLSALAGTATCLVLYLIGRRFGGHLAGLLAALVQAVAFLSVKDAHFATNDVPMVFLVTLTFLLAARFLDEGRTRDLILGGLTAGLATATKYNGVIALLPLGLACSLAPQCREGPERRSRAVQIARRWLALLVLAPAGFLLGNPYAVIDHEAFVSGFARIYGLRHKIWPGQRAEPIPLLALETLRIELGWALLIFVPLAAAVCLVRRGLRGRATVLAISLVLALLLYHLSQAYFMERFLLASTPFLALTCAWGLVSLFEAPWTAWARHRVAIWVGVVAVLIIAPLARSVYFDTILYRPDTRLLAKAYLDRVAPPGSVVVRQTESLYGPPVDPKRHRLLFLKFNRALLDTDRGTGDFYVFNSFDLGQVPGVSEDDERLLMTALERLGFSHVIFSPLRDGGDLWVERALSFRSYRHLFLYERPGPAIVIYARPGTPVLGLPRKPSSPRSLDVEGAFAATV